MGRRHMPFAAKLVVALLLLVAWSWMARAQVRQSLAGNATFVRLPEAGRQEMAEVFIHNFVVQHGAYFGAVRRGDNDLVARLSDAAQARFRREMGVDLRRMSLSSAGFRTGS